MAQQRKFLVIVTGVTPAFNGTAAFVPPWEGKRVNNEKFNVAQRTVVQGRFRPHDLGSTKNVARMMRVYTNGPVVPGDVYSVRSSTNPVHGLPVDIVRETPRPLGTSFELAAPLLVGPTDDLCVEFAGDGDGASLHLLVDDLSAEEWALINAAVAGNDPNQPPQFDTRTVAADTVLAPWVGTLFVQASSAAAGGTVELPPLADVAMGAVCVIFRDGGRWFQVSAAAGEEIDGVAESVVFHEDNLGVVFQKSGVGWTSTKTAQDSVPVDVNNTAVLVVPTQQRTLVRWEAGTGNTLTLPAFGDVALGQEFEIVAGRTTAGDDNIIPAPSDLIDGVEDKQVAVGTYGDTVLVRRVDDGWVSVTNAMLGQIEEDIAGPTALTAWTGQRIVHFTPAAPGDLLTLPALSSVRPGSRLAVIRVGGIWGRVAPNGTDLINDVNGPIDLIDQAGGEFFVAGVDSWASTGVIVDTAPLPVAGTVVLTAWPQRRRTVTWSIGAGTNTLTLPALSTVDLYQELTVIVTVGPLASRAAIRPAAGEGLNGVVNGDVAVVNVGDIVVVTRTPSGWTTTTNFQPVDQRASAAAADPAPTAWRGMRAYHVGYAAAGDFTLPANPPIGCAVLLVQTNANLITVQGNGNTVFLGGASGASRPMPATPNTPVLLTFMGLGWLGVS